MTDHTLRWVSPSPLWGDAARLGPEHASEAMLRPSILRFASDSFMDDFLARMESAPSRLGELQARPETWRRPDVGPLKLYQAAHERYYMLTASLVCAVPGLPDHSFDVGAGERATFVLRRLRPRSNAATGGPCDPKSCDEYAYLTDAQTAVWRKVALHAATSPESLVPGEEQLPLFPVAFREDDGRKRRLLAGLIPTGKREAYLGAPGQQPAGDGSNSAHAQSVAARLLLLQTTVTGPWKNLVEQAAHAKSTMKNSDPPDKPPTLAERQREFVRATRERIQTISWYTLLDLAVYIREQLPRIWDALGGKTPNPPLNSAEQALLAALQAATVGDLLRADLVVPEVGSKTSSYALSAIPGSLAQALTTVVQDEPALERVATQYDRSSPQADWPTFLFPLADPVLPLDAPLASAGKDDVEHISGLETLLVAALPSVPAAPAPMPAFVTQPELDPRGSDWFVLRCVLERPNCGPLVAPVVSAPSTEFQLAGFFDPDAPARPIRIGLPVDISPAGLRKFDKKTFFIMSDLLCGQVNRMKGIGFGDLVLSVLPWPFHKDLSAPRAEACPEGMICSLSIPIITICALILLIIIVSLLNIIFFWLPYLMLCFPFPRFSAKRGS